MGKSNEAKANEMAKAMENKLNELRAEFMAGEVNQARKDAMVRELTKFYQKIGQQFGEATISANKMVRELAKAVEEAKSEGETKMITEKQKKANKIAEASKKALEMMETTAGRGGYGMGFVAGYLNKKLGNNALTNNKLALHIKKVVDEVKSETVAGYEAGQVKATKVVKTDVKEATTPEVVVESTDEPVTA